MACRVSIILLECHNISILHRRLIINDNPSPYILLVWVAPFTCGYIIIYIRINTYFFHLVAQEPITMIIKVWLSH